MPRFQVKRVPREQIEAVLTQILPEVRSGLGRALGAPLAEADLIALITQGDLELWAAFDGEAVLGGIVLHFVPRVRGLVMVVGLVAGRDFQSWAPRAHETLWGYAKQRGAYAVQATCRPGLVRLLLSLGWRRKAVIMELPDWQPAAA